MLISPNGAKLAFHDAIDDYLASFETEAPKEN